MGSPEKRTSGLQVTRVPNSWNPPRRTRDVDIKIEPCKIRNCTTCKEHKASSDDEDMIHDSPSASPGQSRSSSKGKVYSVLWAKVSQKKHKTWEHDGFLTIDGKDLTLMDSSGTILDTVKNYKLPDDLENGSVLKFGGREVQLQDVCDNPPFDQIDEESNNDDDASSAHSSQDDDDDDGQPSQKKRKIVSEPNEIVYSILWAKASQKKNKIWEHDGFLIVKGNDLTLQDTDDKVLDTCKNYKLPVDLESGSVLKLGFREIQIQEICSNSSVERNEMAGPCILELMGYADEAETGNKSAE